MTTSAAPLLSLLLVLPQGPATRPDSRPRPEPPLQSSDLLIIPARAGERVGGTSNSVPFSWTPMRYQQWLAPEEFGYEGILLLGGMRFRRAFRVESGNQGTVDLEIALATAPEGRNTASKVFADNLGLDRQVVFPRQKVEVKESGERQEGKDPLEVWDLAFRFARPFKYRTGRALVLEVTVYGNDHAGGFFMFPLDAWQTEGGTMRIFGDADQEEGKTGPHGLVVRFDVLARAAAPASRPASRAAGGVGQGAASRAAGGTR